MSSICKLLIYEITQFYLISCTLIYNNNISITPEHNIRLKKHLLGLLCLR